MALPPRGAGAPSGSKARRKAIGGTMLTEAKASVSPLVAPSQKPNGRTGRTGRPGRTGGAGRDSRSGLPSRPAMNRVDEEMVEQDDLVESVLPPDTLVLSHGGGMGTGRSVRHSGALGPLDVCTRPRRGPQTGSGAVLGVLHGALGRLRGELHPAHRAFLGSAGGQQRPGHLCVCLHTLADGALLTRVL